MKTISNLLSESAVTAFGWTLIHSLWQGTVLLALAAVTFYLLRKCTANIRYAAGIGFLTLQVFMSIATFTYYQLKITAVIPSAKSAISLGRHSFMPVLNAARMQLPITVKIQLWLSAHLNELVICWLIGAAFLLLRFAGGWIFTERLRSNAKIVMDREWRARFGVIIAKMNISQSIEFRESAKVLTPMVIGAFSPVVLIPLGLLSGFSTSQVEAILAHELAHIRRNDYLVNMLQSLVEVVFFFHPAIWWLSERIRTEREHCCDDIALSVCGDKISLAHALVKVAEWQNAPRMAMAFASKRPLLMQRVQRVLGLSPKSARTFGRIPVMLFAMSLVIGVSVYAVAQKVEKANKRKPAYQTEKIKNLNSGNTEDVEDAVAAIAEISPDIEIAEAPEVDIDEIATIHFDDDSLNKKMNEIHRRMQALQTEMEPLNHRMEEINLEMEKQRFEVERFHREMEKLEWKKNTAMELRSDLMEKRSELFDGNRKANQTKQAEPDIDKQLADFEQQIKKQEETVSELNSQIAATRKEIFKAEEPIRKLESEMEEINEKVEDINGKIGLESLGFEKIEATARPRMARTARVNRNFNGHRVAPPPPPAKAKAPNQILKPAKAPAPPKAPPVAPAAPIKK
ncbi:M56 family metallopeptidase [Dyadobacter arcticus]|uniref:Beta-lactamase regulating signal transducer with metallopeptidase domain/predicted nucleic acid-binding Zn-ribbon protein n=1 Tax=Dyadobacter arcticus TaxID=1078754 RepID=A0ABX0UEE3_9BACT|nr:M56 family metallopeptidase [Dyadobacter arcticus]NIJ50908.1 beta-lactamase regulating signal transducer with metallopeptidase domain/predicted nucleic acid-binding Zn-ribbon protein [Dyadobacter arcticus]